MCDRTVIEIQVSMMSNSKLSFCHVSFSANTQVPDEGLAQAATW